MQYEKDIENILFMPGQYDAKTFLNNNKVSFVVIPSRSTGYFPSDFDHTPMKVITDYYSNLENYKYFYSDRYYHIFKKI